MEQLFLDGCSLVKKKEYNKSIIYFELCIEKNFKAKESYKILLLIADIKQDEKMLYFYIDKSLYYYPDEEVFIINKINSLIRKARFDEAMHYFYSLKNKKNINLDKNINYIKCLYKTGKKSEALNIIDENYKNNNNFILKIELEEIKKNKDIFEKLINIYNNENKNIINLIVNNVYDLKSYDLAVKILDKEIESADKLKKINFYFQKSLLCDEYGDFRKAFDAAEKGHLLQEMPDKDYYNSFFENIKKVFTKEYIYHKKNNIPSNNFPIFIVGLPRSGTSLIEQIISMNPNVKTLGETNNINKIINMFTKYNERNIYPFKFKNLKNKQIEALSNKYLNEVNHPIYTDKLPHNFLNIGLIKKIIPNSRFIFCERNINDVILSIYLRNFTGNHSYANDFEYLNVYSRKYVDLLSFWYKNLDNNDFLIVNYENIVNNPITEINRLIDFLKLSKEYNYLDFYNSKRDVKTASKDQVKKPIYKSSVNKWLNYKNFFE